MSNERVNIVRELQSLIRKTNVNDVTIKYGYKENGVFVKSDVDVNTDPSKRECVLIKYDSQSDEFGIVQSIEMNGLFWIIKDVINAIDKL